MLSLRKIRDVAMENISKYEGGFQKVSNTIKENMGIVKSYARPSFNTSAEVAIKVITDRRKSMFEICAERIQKPFPEFCELENKQQLSLIIQDKTSPEPEYITLMQRRVDFSNRFIDGLGLNYFSLSMTNETIGNTHYGKCHVILKSDAIKDAVALKHDSLRHYYDDETGEFMELMCFEDLLIYEHIDWLIWDKLKDSSLLNSTEEIIQSIELEVKNNDKPLEVMTSEKIDGTRIAAVLFPRKDYDFLTIELNIRKVTGGILTPKEEEDLLNFAALQNVLVRYKIPLKIVES